MYVNSVGCACRWRLAIAARRCGTPPWGTAAGGRLILRGAPWQQRAYKRGKALIIALASIPIATAAILLESHAYRQNAGHNTNNFAI